MRRDSAGRMPVHRMIASAPVRVPSAHSTPPGGEAGEHRAGLEQATVAGFAYGRDGDDVAE